MVGVEVKSELSKEHDIVRGLFQCVKYRSLSEAWAIYNNEKADIDIYLAMDHPFPENLLPIKNVLGIKVIDRLREKRKKKIE